MIPEVYPVPYAVVASEGDRYRISVMEEVETLRSWLMSFP